MSIRFRAPPFPSQHKTSDLARPGWPDQAPARARHSHKRVEQQVQGNGTGTGSSHRPRAYGLRGGLPARLGSGTARRRGPPLSTASLPSPRTALAWRLHAPPLRRLGAGHPLCPQGKGGSGANGKQTGKQSVGIGFRAMPQDRAPGGIRAACPLVSPGHQGWPPSVASWLRPRCALANPWPGAMVPLPPAGREIGLAAYQGGWRAEGKVQNLTGGAARLAGPTCKLRSALS